MPSFRGLLDPAPDREFRPGSEIRGSPVGAARRRDGADPESVSENSARGVDF